MGIIKSVNKRFGLQIRGKVGHATKYGKRLYGEYQYGEEPPTQDIGEEEPWNRWGIYRVMSVKGHQVNVKERFYIPHNPQTEAQQANRNKFKDAISAWYALTDEEKEVYNERAKGKNMTGYNIFVKEYMLS